MVRKIITTQALILLVLVLLSLAATRPSAPIPSSRKPLALTEHTAAPATRNIQVAQRP